MGLQTSKIYYQGKHQADHYYLCNYRPLHAGGDRLSRSLLRFKEALAHDLQAWIDCALTELGQTSFPPDTILIRALASYEKRSSPQTRTALDQLGAAIALKVLLNWKPSLLEKHRTTRPHKNLAAADRWKEVRDVHHISEHAIKPGTHHFLLIDDILTTGATVVSIIRLLKSFFPAATCSVFTLAKSDQYSTLNTHLQLASAGYTWEQGAGWQVAEEEEGWSSYSNLVNCILKDDFSDA
jgi:predicted amidophosphoribosyltransferase